MSGYVKIWTDIRNDEWFIGLRLIERGLWYELLTITKVRGDSGRFFVRSRAALAQEVGGDDSTVTRILGKFRQDGKISLRELPGKQLEITIPNYVQWQELTKDGAKDKIAKSRRKTVENSPLPDQTRAEQTKPDQTNRTAPTAPIENSITKTPEQMKSELAPILGWGGEKKKEPIFGDYMLAVCEWLTMVYPDEPVANLKVTAGSITKSIAKNAFGKTEQYHKSWPPIPAFVEFLKLSIGEPLEGGGLQNGRNYPKAHSQMIRFVNQVFLDGQQTHEYAHAAYQKAGVL